MSPDPVAVAARLARAYVRGLRLFWVTWWHAKGWEKPVLPFAVVMPYAATGAGIALGTRAHWSAAVAVPSLVIVAATPVAGLYLERQRRRNGQVDDMLEHLNTRRYPCPVCHAAPYTACQEVYAAEERTRVGFWSLGVHTERTEPIRLYMNSNALDPDHLLYPRRTLLERLRGRHTVWSVKMTPHEPEMDLIKRVFRVKRSLR